MASNRRVHGGDAGRPARIGRGRAGRRPRRHAAQPVRRARSVLHAQPADPHRYAPATPASARCRAARRSARRWTTRGRWSTGGRSASHMRFSTACARRSPTATPAAAACRPSTCARRSTSSPPIECALLDLFGQPRRAAGGRAARRRPAARRACEMLGYLFFVGDRTTHATCPTSTRARCRRRMVALRHEPALSPERDRAPGRGGTRDATASTTSS